MNHKAEIGRVWQLLFTEEEEKKIIALLNRHRLPPDNSGLKLYVLGKLGKQEATDLSPELQGLIEKGLSAAGHYIKKRAGF